MNLHIDWNSDVGDTSRRKRRANRQIGDTFYVGATHDPLVEMSHVDEQLVECDVLLGERAYEVAVLQTSDSQNRRMVHLRIIETIQQMNAARARGCDAHANAPGEFCIGTGHESRCLFVPDLNKPDAVLVRSQRFEYAVYAVARITINPTHAPFVKTADEKIADFHGGFLRRTRWAFSF